MDRSQKTTDPEIEPTTDRIVDSGVRRTPATMTPFARFLSYVYFIRFGLLLWASMPALACLDAWIGRSFTRGIIALSDPWHLFFASFFCALSGWIALLTARVVCAYGEDRFGIAPPGWMRVGLGRMSALAFWGAQVPGFILLAYSGYRTHMEEKLGYPLIIGMFLLGLAAAIFCWILQACIYYWLFLVRNPRDPNLQTQDCPRAFLIPCEGPFAWLKRWFDFLLDREPSVFLLVLLELGKWPARLGPGYSKEKRPFNPLCSGHSLVLLTLAFTAAIYGVFWDFTSPVPLRSVHMAVTFAIPLLLAAWVVGVLIYGADIARRRSGWKPFGFLNLLLMLGLFSPMICVCLLPYTLVHRALLMPVLATISVLLVFVTCILGGLAFFLDRFRVPVLSSALAGIVLINLPIPGLPPPDDHTVTVSHRGFDPGRLRTPDRLLAEFQQISLPGQQWRRPVIIVTATGGGIHAAAWTGSVLGLLEKEFRAEQPLTPFHDSVLMFSTVSGGSVGAVPWAAEYAKDPPDFSDPALERMTKVAGCSDLQGVAWGLAYADFMRLLYPSRFLPGRFDEFDRGWALQKAFWRNRLNGCDPDRMEQRIPLEEDSLSDLIKPRVPSFSFNATVAETGDRFLLANYAIPKQNLINAEVTPAPSFLEVYGTDLPLSSAARMSACFPYISPMAKVPIKDSHFHFGDGGYFDNDGTATAMEYLWFAFHPAAAPAGVPAASGTRIPILVVEIRDSNDLRANEQADDLQHQAPKSDWGLAGQATGPLVAFYQAGHSSVTVRNRRELCFLEHALNDQARISHVVFDYAKGPGDVQPLSWHLTARQLDDIASRLEKVRDKAHWATEWFSKALKSPAEGANSCTRD